MTGEARFEALGFSFALECEDAELQDYLEGVLAAFAFGGPVAHRYVLRSTGEPSEELPHEVMLDGERIAGAAVGWAMVDSVVHDLNRRVVDSSPHLLLHAGGVAGNGAAAALPGHMEAGKTTLTAGLVRSGLTYLTDEALALDRETLLVHPYPKPLSIDPGAWPFFAGLAPPPVTDGGFEYVQWQVPATAIRPGAVAAPCPVVVVVFPRYEPGVDTVLEPIGRAEALVELAKNTFRFRERGAPELDLLADLVRRVECYRLRMGELDGAVDLVAGLLGVTPDREPVA